MGVDESEVPDTVGPRGAARASGIGPARDRERSRRARARGSSAAVHPWSVLLSYVSSARFAVAVEAQKNQFLVVGDFCFERISGLVEPLSAFGDS